MTYRFCKITLQPVAAGFRAIVRDGLVKWSVVAATEDAAIRRAKAEIDNDVDYPNDCD